MSEPAPITTVVVKRDDVPPSGTVATTPWGEPNIRVIAMHWGSVLAVRCGRAFFVATSGFLSANGVGALPSELAKALPDNFWDMLPIAARVGAAAAVVAFLLNGGELLGKLDEKLPQLRA